MNYTIKVNVVKTSNEETKIKGFANVVFDDSMKITNISIIENSKTGDPFVSMPRYRSGELGDDGQPIYKDVCNPITKEFRDELYKNILAAYEQTVADPNTSMEIDAASKKEPDFQVRMHPLDKEGSNVKAIGQIYIADCFVINNVNVIEGKKGLFVTMPSYKTKKVDEAGKAVYQDICYPITKDFRDKLFSAILDNYTAERNKAVQEPEKIQEQSLPFKGKDESKDEARDVNKEDSKDGSKDDSKDDKTPEEKTPSKKGRKK